MNLKSLTQPELADIIKELGQPQFRAKQRKKTAMF